MSHIAHRAAFVVSVALALASSCDLPMAEAAILDKAKDTVPPSLTISSPLEDSTCSNIVEVRGVTKDSIVGGGPGRVASLGYSVANSNIAGSATPDADGSFSFQFDAHTFDGQFSLLVESLDWNGNRTTRTILLKRDAANGIPGLTAVPGNATIKLSWSSVPNTDRYLLYYTSDGSLPSETRGQVVTVAGTSKSYTILDCVNGALYCLRLKAIPKAGWTESASDYLKTIPLSPMSLCPRVEDESGLIRLSWNGLPAAGNYEIWRRIGESGDFSLYTETSATEFLDRNVEPGQDYGYKIKPSLHSPILSYANSARPTSFLKRPTIAGSVSGFGSAKDVTISGNYAFVSDNCDGNLNIDLQGLYIYDISAPRAPRLVKRLKIYARAAVVSGNYAYVLTNEDRGMESCVSSLSVVDVSVPSQAVVLGSVDIQDTYDDAISAGWKTRVYDLALDGSTVYVAAGRDGLQAFDVSDPASPRYLDCCPMAADPGNSAGIGIAAGIAIKDGYAFVGSYNGIRTVKLADMSIVRNLAMVAGTDRPMKLVVKGDGLFVVHGLDGISVHRITMSSGTPEVSSVYKRIDTSGYAQDLDLQNNLLYVADGASGLQAIDVYDTDPYLAAWDPPPSALAAKLAVPMPTEALSVAVSGSYAYVALQFSLQVVDLSLASEARIVKTVSIQAGQAASSVEMLGSRAYVATNQGLWVANLADPADPAMSLAMGDTWFEDLAISGPYLFGLGVGNLNGKSGYGLVCDLSDPASPRLAAVFGIELRGLAQIQVSGAYAYLACDSGLVVLDLNDPLNPKTITTVQTGKTFGVELKGSLAYVSCSGGLDIVDVSDPDRPIILSNLPIQSGTYSLNRVTVSGRYAYACDSKLGLFVVDVQDPENPRLAKTLKHRTPSVSDSAKYLSFRAIGPWGIVTSSQNLAQIVNIGDPERAFLVGGLQESPQDQLNITFETAVYDGWAYMTDALGLRVIELRR